MDYSNAEIVRKLDKIAMMLALALGLLTFLIVQVIL